MKKSYTHRDVLTIVLHINPCPKWVKPVPDEEDFAGKAVNPVQSITPTSMEETMKTLDRRTFLKVGGAGIAGLSLQNFSLPILGAKKASAAMSKNAWSFGVMADTQWRTGVNAGGESGSCATTIIDALNRQFIAHNCRFVIQVGDLVDVESVNGVRTLPTRRNHAQALYDAGIGFFPVRGNHESSAVAAAEMPVLFPQMLGKGGHLFGANDFDSPVLNATATDPMGTRLKGLTYSFDYANARFILIDQFIRADGSNFDGTKSYNNNAVDQIDWVDAMLASNSADDHAFVFSHKNLIGQNHKDVLFGANLTSNASARDEFIKSLNQYGVRYCLGGHDHMHHRSIVKSGDGKAAVGQIICASNSYKFYIPKVGDDGREIPLGQELFSIGYYIFTVDGPRVTVDFYASNHGEDYGDTDLVTAPYMRFHHRERFGYSLNGHQYHVPRGGSYKGIEGTCQGTVARILSGVNGNRENDYLSRALYKTVCTGWTRSGILAGSSGPVFSLWGLADNLSLHDSSLTGLLPSMDEPQVTDIFTLSVSYDSRYVRPSQLVSGKFALASAGDDNGWVNAVDLNSGGTKKFVYGPWKETYGLGTYGIDPKTATAWAVLNHEGDFSVRMTAS